MCVCVWGGDVNDGVERVHWYSGDGDFDELFGCAMAMDVVITTITTTGCARSCHEA